MLVDQFSDATLTVQKEGEKEPTIPQRCKYIFAIAYPSFWELKRELGARFLEMGAAATALQIFEELEMWDEIIECYQIMGLLCLVTRSYMLLIILVFVTRHTTCILLLQCVRENRMFIHPVQIIG